MQESLFSTIKNLTLNKGQIAICWLGQAGFLFKTSSDQYFIIDPYLSDLCEKRLGPKFKRHSPSLITPEEIDGLGLTAYLMTHHHEDHLDSDGIAVMNDNKFPFYGPPTVIRILKELGIEEHRCHAITPGETHEIGECNVHSLFADHGELAPDAVGIMIEVNGKLIYHMGDTAYRPEQFAEIGKRFKINMIISPINGKYGNMNESEAARAVGILKAEKAVPCHYWMLPGNSGGNPSEFIDEVSKHAPLTEALIMTVGEILMLS